MAGRYEVRDEIVLGVEVVGVWWVAQAAPPSLMIRLGRERVPMLAEALSEYLDRNPAGNDPASRDPE
jgi:hypothetical protein